jgi:flagellar protein FlbD
LNAELIETVEETPDTVITLMNGNKVLVEEGMDDIIRLVIEYRRALNRFGR